MSGPPRGRLLELMSRQNREDSSRGAIEAAEDNAGMNAEPFHADEVHPPIVIQADDDTPLNDSKGWSCAACGILYTEQVAAEVCCMEPDSATGESRLRDERQFRSS
jgi:hypothetical protein